MVIVNFHMFLFINNFLHIYTLKQHCDIVTYGNNPSYISMVILIFLSVRANTDQIHTKLIANLDKLKTGGFLL